jgi:hypothetical protein
MVERLAIPDSVNREAKFNITGIMRPCSDESQWGVPGHRTAHGARRVNGTAGLEETAPDWKKRHSKGVN